MKNLLKQDKILKAQDLVLIEKTTILKEKLSY